MWSQPPWSNSPWVYFSYGFVSNATLNGLLMPFSPFSLASPFSSLSSSLSNASHHHGSGIKRSVHMAVATGWALSKLPMCIQPLQRLAMRPLDFCRFSLFEVCIYLATSRFTSLCFWHLVQCKYSFPRPEQVRCSCFALVRSACFATIARVCFVHQLTDPKNLFYHMGVICWSYVEVGVALITSSVATLRPLLDEVECCVPRWRRLRSNKYTSNGSNNVPSSTTFEEALQRHNRGMSLAPITPLSQV